MANRDSPCGFRPASGVGSPHRYFLFRVDAANATAIFIGDVLDFDTYSVGPAAADAGVSVAGVAVAVYDTNMVPCGHPNSAVSTKYLSATTAGYVLVALPIPGAVFICQSSTGTTYDEDSIGLTADHVAGTGDTATAKSRHELNSTSGGLQFRIIGLVNRPDNTWAEHADLYVVFNEAALSASAAASV